MHNRDFMDLGRLFDKIFETAESFSDQFGKFDMNFTKSGEHRDFYSIYPFPPVNTYMSPDKTMVFEFALAGYNESDITLQFQGDYMVLDASAPEQSPVDEDVIFFNRRLKFKPIVGQKYYVPADKFDHDSAKAVFKQGILKVSVPPKEDTTNPPGVKIEIVKEDEE